MYLLMHMRPQPRPPGAEEQTFLKVLQGKVNGLDACLQRNQKLDVLHS